jgi:hypothetical protein
MFLRNYDNICTARSLISADNKILSTDTTTFGDGHLNAKDITGTICAIYNSSNAYYNPLNHMNGYANDNIKLSYASSNLVIGGGDTPVTYDDYALVSKFASSQVQYVRHQTVQNTTFLEDQVMYETKYQKVFMALEEITVKEIGIEYGSLRDSAANAYNTTLVYREVLDNPIVVPANTNFIITLTQRLGTNPNKPADYVATASVE